VNESFKGNDPLLRAGNYPFTEGDLVVHLVNHLPHSSPRKRCSTHNPPCLPSHKRIQRTNERIRLARELLSSSVFRSCITRSLRHISCTPRFSSESHLLPQINTTTGYCMNLYSQTVYFFYPLVFLVIKYTIFNAFQKNITSFSIVLYRNVH
jgi:hypothetical protein